MHIVLFDLPEDRIKLFPLTHTRPISYLRVGILTVVEKWERYCPNWKISVSTADYLTGKFGKSNPEDSLWINASFLPNQILIEALGSLKENQALYSGEKLIAFQDSSLNQLDKKIKVDFSQTVNSISRTWDLFMLNGQEIANDYNLITKGRNSKVIIDPYTKTYGKEIFIEEGVSIKAATLNAENGPIYLGKNSEIQEGAIIRGPFALGEGSVVNLGAKVRGATTLGPYCKIGGEVSNSILMGYSNKGHDGFLGNSVLGEWCNIGADSNNSNLKNDYSEVKMWDYQSDSFMKTGLQFCGLIMGDHTKCGINTMFNTGTTIGVNANVFGSGFPRTYIPSFSWGGALGFKTYLLDKAIETAEHVTSRKKTTLTGDDKEILTYIFENHSFKQ